MPPSPTPHTWKQVVELSAQFAEPRPTRLHVGSAILAWFREQPRRAPAPCMPAVDLLGLPVIPDADLDDGQWVVYDRHGAVLETGRVGPPGVRIFYFGGAFLHFDVSVT